MVNHMRADKVKLTLQVHSNIKDKIIIIIKDINFKTHIVNKSNNNKKTIVE